MYIGTSINLPSDIITNIIDTNSIQIMFSKSNLTIDELKNIKKYIQKYKYKYLHASYKINIGTEMIKINIYNPSFELLIKQIKYAKYLGLNGLILHMGKNIKNKSENSHVYNNMIKFLLFTFKKIYKLNFDILLETPAGQKGEMCFDLYEFVNFILLFKSTKYYNNINICIDTCHIFQAGYDLNNIDVIHKVHKIFEPVKHKIKLIHFNDSANEFNKHLDRHAQIGKGFIKVKNLIKFIKPYKNIPLILETIGPYDEQIKLINNNL